MRTKALPPFRITRDSRYSFCASGHVYGLPSVVHTVSATPVLSRLKPLSVSDRGLILRAIAAEPRPESVNALVRLTCVHQGTPTHLIEISYRFDKGSAVVTLFSMFGDFGVEGIDSNYIARSCCLMICSILFRPYLSRYKIRPSRGNSALTTRSNQTKLYWLSLILTQYKWETKRASNNTF